MHDHGLNGGILEILVVNFTVDDSGNFWYSLKDWKWAGIKGGCMKWCGFYMVRIVPS